MSTMAAWLWPLVTAPVQAQAPNSRRNAAHQQVDDAELVDRARSGDPDSMQQIYQRHADRVFRRLTHLVGPDPEREDLLQEVFIAFFRGLQAYRGEASLSTYLQRVAANKACDHLRRRSRTRHGTSQLEAEQLAGHSPSPERQAQGSEDAALFWRSLEQLTPKKRIALVLRVVEGLSLKQISQQVGASVDTVAQRIRHGKRELIEMVRQHLEEDDR